MDDNEPIRQMLALLLTRAIPDSVVETAADGLAAQSMIPAFKPHLVVTDLQMPRLDGAGLCRWVKSNGFAHTKVLMLTGSLLAPDIEVGADAWLAKPPRVAELLYQVDKLLAAATPS